MYFVGYERSISWNNGSVETSCIVTFSKTERNISPSDRDTNTIFWDLIVDVQYNVSSGAILEKNGILVEKAFPNRLKDENEEKYAVGTIHKCYYHEKNNSDLRFKKKDAKGLFGGFIFFLVFGAVVNIAILCYVCYKKTRKPVY